MLEVKPVPAFKDNYIWLIINQPSRQIAIVDPGDAIPVLKEIKQNDFIPCAILATHHHGDHVGGVTTLLKHFDIPVYGPAFESIPRRTYALKEGDTVELSELSISFNILDMPGHTAGAIAYYGEGMVFVGDTLFMSGCGRLFEGTPAQMYHSLGKLAALPDNIKIYCAHEYTLANLRFAATVEPNNPDIQARISESQSLLSRNLPTVPGTLAVEKLTNPFLRTDAPELIQSANAYMETSLNDAVEIFAAIRSWKDSFQ